MKRHGKHPSSSIEALRINLKAGCKDRPLLSETTLA